MKTLLLSLLLALTGPCFSQSATFISKELRYFELPNDSMFRKSTNEFRITLGKDTTVGINNLTSGGKLDFKVLHRAYGLENDSPYGPKLTFLATETTPPHERVVINIIYDKNTLSLHSLEVRGKKELLVFIILFKESEQ